MRKIALLFMAVCAAMCFTETQSYGQSVTFGTWQDEGTGTVTGSGDSFTASPTAIATPVIEGVDNFAERNAERHRVYQTFPPMDFSMVGDEVHVTFDITFDGIPENLDTGVRVSLVDTSTNQGIYPVGWDAGGRVGTYNRTRFIDNLDGPNAEMHGGDHGGAFTDAINGSGTIAQSNAAPTITDGAVEEGLIDGNTVSFSIVMTRDAGNTFSYATNVTEKNGLVVYPEVAGSFDVVAGGGGGDTSVAGIAINSLDGIVFGLFSDDPFLANPGGSYTVSNICVSDTAKGVVLLSEDFDYPDGDLVGNGDWVGYGSDQRQPVQVESGQAVIAGEGIQDVNVPFGGATGILYYSIEFSVDDLGAPYPLDDSPDFEYFVTFYDGNGGDNLSARIDIQAPSGAGDFTVGIASDEGTADATWATDLTYDTTYRAVVSYDQVNNLAQLWIDPIVESDTSILGENRLATEGIGGDTPTAVALRQASSDGAETIRVDNLLVGTSFDAVVPTTTLLGDANCDGMVDFRDIVPFIAFLSNNEFKAEADIDGSGAVDFRDIVPFIGILSGS